MLRANYSVLGADGFASEDAGGVAFGLAGGAFAIRILLSRLRCFVTKALMTCAANLAELLPQ